MNNQIISFIKWAVLIFIAALAFHFVYPKYYFMKEETILFRANTINGKVEIWGGAGMQWQDVVDFQKQYRKLGP